jgi:hypothetical protein
MAERLQVNQMVTFTLDTNCLIDVDEKRPARDSVLQLIAAADKGIADVAMVASSASERQPGGQYLKTFVAFKDRMQKLGFGSVKMLMPIAYQDLSFWDYAILPSDSQKQRERLIFETLFPDTPYSWQEYAAANNVKEIDAPLAFKWRNKLCDAQAFWAHDDNRRDVFVTSDERFRMRLSTKKKFLTSTIATPIEAARDLL